MALQRLKDAAEKAKIELSSVRETEINLPFIISSGRNEALHLQRVLTRADVRAALRATSSTARVDIVRQTLDDAGIGRDEIEEVVLVGGMTRMPRVERAVAEFFGREPSKGVHPDEVVALGAAIQGAALRRRAAEDDPARRDAAHARRHGRGRALRAAHPAEHARCRRRAPSSSPRRATTRRR